METTQIYTFLRTGMILVLWATGYALSKKNRESPYWLAALPAIVVYSLVEGLRYDRGYDYMHYKKVYEYAFNLDAYYSSSSFEPVFQILNKAIHLFGAPFYVAFIAYSIVLIIGGLSFIRERTHIAMYSLPAFMMATIVQSETLVRQFIAFGFVLLSIRPLLNNQWLRSAVFFAIATQIHSSTLVFLPAIAVFRLVRNPFYGAAVVIPAFLLTFMWKPEYWGSYYGYFQHLSLGASAGQSYLDNADFWFSGERQQVFETSTFSLFRNGLADVILVYFGYRLPRYKDDAFLRLSFHLFIVGLLTQKLTYRIEILHRLHLYFYMFWFIPFAYIVRDALHEKGKSIVYKASAVVLIVNVMYNYFNPILNVKPPNSLFVWDTKKTLK